MTLALVSGTELRLASRLDGGAAAASVESPLAETWVCSSGPNRSGNVILLELAGEDLRPMEGSLKVWTTDGTCETFQRTRPLC